MDPVGAMMLAGCPKLTSMLRASSLVLNQEMNNKEVEKDKSKREVKSRLVYGLYLAQSAMTLYRYRVCGLILCEARITCKSCQIQSKSELDNKNRLGPILRSRNRLGPVLIAKTLWPI